MDLNNFATESKLNSYNVSKACDPKEYGNKSKYPYINYLPFTTITKKAAQYENMLRSFKTKPSDDKISTVYERRMQIKTSGKEEMYCIRYPQLTQVTKCSFTPPAKSLVSEAINYYVVEYDGSNIRNGTIIICHGGGYALCSAKIKMNSAELISKLTGCVVVILDYKLSPEYALPHQTNELIELYKYMQTKYNISPHRIAFTGDSAGGGMILLALQSMKYGAYSAQNIALPACVWLNSAWTCLNIGDLPSHINNANIDAAISGNTLRLFASYAIGEKDGNGNAIGNSTATADNEIFSPVYGKFDGLCAMYLMVCATEMLLDDTLECARKAYEAEVDVVVDIHPFMQHAWSRELHIHSEAFVATVRGSEWILRQFNAKQSKL